MRRSRLCVAVAMLAAGCGSAAARSAFSSIRPMASNLVLPQRRVFSSRARPSLPPVEITGVTAGVVILEQAATTTLDIALRNPAGAQQEAELLVPVPDGAVVRGFTFQGGGKEPSAEVLPKDTAKATYDAIVAKIRDPALLEFVGYNLVRSSVFPVPAGGTQKVRLTYENLLAADGGRIDYVLPRTEALDYSVPWQVSVAVKAKRPVSTVYSPSHKLDTKRLGKNAVVATLSAAAIREPGAFRLSYLLGDGGVSASLFAYPDPKTGGGYFLLLAGLPAKPPEGKDGPAIKREITLVFDRSGSMNGEKIEQVREAANQILAGLDDGETFNLFVYNSQVDRFADTPVAKTKETMAAAREYLRGINARGGTNIHDALVEALRQKPAEGMLPMVLFLTDGLPTVGKTSEVAIRDVAMKANPHERRLFTFGVGVDVNTPLLERLALETRATSTFVLPGEDVEVKVASVFKRLAGPVLADGKLETLDADGKPAPRRTRDVIPARLPDLFEGDQLVVLGQYVGDEPLHFSLSGNYLGKKRAFRFRFPIDKATTRNAFVPRLWASRRIATLVDAIRATGANGELATVVAKAGTDPKLKELSDEIVRLSREFGILTEYTAFLAREGTDLSRREDVLNEARANFVGRAVSGRYGISSVNQDINRRSQRRQQELNFRNYYRDANMNRVEVATVQQVSDRAFFRRGRRWVDSRIVEQEATVKPSRVVEFGSADFRKLALRLADEGRQGCIALEGEILLVVDGAPVLVRGPAQAPAAQSRTSK